jgi:hypothetical protein
MVSVQMLGVLGINILWVRTRPMDTAVPANPGVKNLQDALKIYQPTASFPVAGSVLLAILQNKDGSFQDLSSRAISCFGPRRHSSLTRPKATLGPIRLCLTDPAFAHLKCRKTDPRVPPTLNSFVIEFFSQDVSKSVVDI